MKCHSLLLFLRTIAVSEQKDNKGQNIADHIFMWSACQWHVVHGFDPAATAGAGSQATLAARRDCLFSGRRLASLSIGGDALHNLTDGALIALAFAASPQLGLVTTLAVLAHELPQELGDYAILLQSGLSPRKALLANLASASTIFIGASSGLLLGHVIEGFVALLTPIIAGSFLYLAGFILLPALQRHRVPVRGFALTRLLPLTLGLSTMAILALAESWLDLSHPHQHAHPHPTSSEAENTAPNFSPLG